MISAGPSSSNLMASLAKGRTQPNSSVTRRTTRVESAPSAINSVSSGSSRNFVSTPLPGMLLRDHLFSLDVALDPQVSPLVEQFSHFKDEGRVAKMRELLPVGIDIGDQLVVDVELEVVAIGAHDGLRESDRTDRHGPNGTRAPARFLLRDHTAICRIPRLASVRGTCR